MDWIEGLLQPTVTTAIWAFMLYRLGVHVAGRFDAVVENAVRRLRKLGPAEFEPLDRNQASESARHIETSSSPPGELPTPADSLFGRFSTSVQEWATTIPESQREHELIKSVAGWQIGWVFEVTNFYVLGSQLALLQALNSQPLRLEQVREFYAHAANEHPEFYESYSFEGWLSWLQDTANAIALP
jgi:hypothetical protein